MSGHGKIKLRIHDETAPLRQVIIGLGAPYQRDKKRIGAEMQEFPLVPETDRKDAVLALTYPDETLLIREYADFVAVLENHAVEVLRADPEAAYSFDYTCPRDIGCVVGDTFFVANMAVPSRAREIDTIRHHLDAIEPERIVTLPRDCLLEGGDVVALGPELLLVGYHRRTNRRGAEFLRDYFGPRGIEVIPVAHRQLHLDCCLNPLGRGHLLIHPDSLVDIDGALRAALEPLDWIPVDDLEREYLATNVLSIDPDTIVARDHPACTRVNRELAARGYRVEAIAFDGVPATGGSFRCASLPLCRFD